MLAARKAKIAATTITAATLILFSAALIPEPVARAAGDKNATVTVTCRAYPPGKSEPIDHTVRKRFSEIDAESSGGTRDAQVVALEMQCYDSLKDKAGMAMLPAGRVQVVERRYQDGKGREYFRKSVHAEEDSEFAELEKNQRPGKARMGDILANVQHASLKLTGADLKCEWLAKDTNGGVQALAIPAHKLIPSAASCGSRGDQKSEDRVCMGRVRCTGGETKSAKHSTTVVCSAAASKGCQDASACAHAFFDLRHDSQLEQDLRNGTPGPTWATQPEKSGLRNGSGADQAK